MEKICRGCGLLLPYSRFNKHSETKDGLRSKCIECRRVEHILYRKKNPAKIKDLYSKANTRKKYSQKSHRTYKGQRNLASKRESDAFRRARKRDATPEWLSLEDRNHISDLFEICSMFRYYTGYDYHVDHIVPLTNSRVCGLHIPINLRVILAVDNMSKNNKFDESMAIDYTAPAYSKSTLL